jgi:type II secretory ATPase GspE/PulE/Tfp pilus assembly ATPase PilB-like protein
LQKIIISPSATDLDIEKIASQNGTLLMLQDGILKALEGETSIEEVLRVAK